MGPNLPGMLETLVVVLPVLWWAVVASVVASGAAAIAGRITAGESVNDRSRCACGRPLTAAELVPVVSWLRVRGRGRCCGSPIPRRLVVGEASALLATALAAAAGGWPAAAVTVAVVAVANAWVNARVARRG